MMHPSSKYPSKLEVENFFASSNDQTLILVTILSDDEVHIKPKVASTNHFAKDATKSISRLINEMSKPLPRITVLMTFADHPLSDANRNFVFENSCKQNDNRLLSPMWFFFVEKDINDVLAIDFPWNSKKEKTIWRGRTTGSTVELSRKVVVDIGKQRPDILDAGFVNFVQGAEKRPEFVKDPVKLIPFMRPVEMTAYKFILIVDGNASSCALYWALSSGSLVLLYSTYKMWFSQYFSGLCVVVDKTNLISTIERVKQENFKSKFIADMAREESKKLFNSKAVAKYFKLVLQKVEIDQLISVRLS